MDKPLFPAQRLRQVGLADVRGGAGAHGLDQLASRLEPIAARRRMRLYRAVAVAHFHPAFIEDHAALAVEQIDVENGAPAPPQLVTGGHRKGALRGSRQYELGDAYPKRQEEGRGGKGW